MNKTWLVIKEIHRREIESWPSLLMIPMPFIVLVISFLFGMSLSSALDDSTEVGIVSQNENLLQSLKKTKDFDMYRDRVGVEKAYQAGDINGYVVIKGNSTQLGTTYRGSEGLDGNLKDESM